MNFLTFGLLITVTILFFNSRQFYEKRYVARRCLCPLSLPFCDSDSPTHIILIFVTNHTTFQLRRVPVKEKKNSYFKSTLTRKRQIFWLPLSWLNKSWRPTSSHSTLKTRRMTWSKEGKKYIFFCFEIPIFWSLNCLVLYLNRASWSMYDALSRLSVCPKSST